MILWQNIFCIGFLPWTRIYSLTESEHDEAVQGEHLNFRP